LWSFSQWFLVSSIGNFFSRKLDELILGRIGTAQDLGVYNVASEIGQTVTVEISAPVNRTLFPVLSSMQNDKSASIKLFFSTLGIINTFTIPVGIGMCLVATPFVQVILGHKWLAAIPILQIFAIQGSIRFVVSPYYVWLMVIGHSKKLATMSWLELLLFLVFVAFLYEHGVLGLAWARLLTTLATVMIWIVMGYSTGLRPFFLFKALFRPIIASAVMGLVLWFLPNIMKFSEPYIELLVYILFGVFSYTISLVLAWLAMKRPDGIERSIFNQFDKYMSRVKA
jgi:O-antigen/teichoic acid export membrane protein